MLPFIIVESPIARKLHSHMLYKCRGGCQGRHCAGCQGTAANMEDKSWNFYNSVMVVGVGGGKHEVTHSRAADLKLQHVDSSIKGDCKEPQASLAAQLVKNPPAMQETPIPSLGWEVPCRRAWQPTPVFLPGESHGQRSLAGYSPRGRRVGRD